MKTTWRRLRTYALEAKYECLKQLRLPAFLFFGLAFPATFYTLFSIVFERSEGLGGASFGTYYLATYGAFSVISAALFGFGTGIATERGQGWMGLKQASPMPPGAYFFGKLVACLLSATAIVVLLTASGIILGVLRIGVADWLRLAATLVGGAVPFCALGLVIGYWAGPNSAVGVVNFINMPMAIVSGLWIPLEYLPALFRKAAPWLPSYHFSQLALDTIGASRQESNLGHVSVLAVFAGFCLALAYVGFRRDEGNTYG